MDASEAADALSAMQASRDRLAALANCPPQRHLAFAALLGGLVACQAAPPTAVLLFEAVFMVGVALIVLWDRRRTGMFINGYRAGRTRPLTFALLAITLALGALGVWLKEERGVVWAPIPCGIAVAIVAYGMSALWQNIYRRELRDMV